jgi:hypothetical protein
MGIYLNPSIVDVCVYGERSSYCILYTVSFFSCLFFSEKGAELLECPITGGLDALKKGQMATWVAGNKVGYIATKYAPWQPE